MSEPTKGKIRRALCLVSMGIMLVLLVNSNPCGAQDGPKSASPWETIAPFFSPPAEFKGQLGDYRSPLKFADGSTVTVDPVEPPFFVAVESTRVVQGERFGVRYHAPVGEDVDRMVVVAAGESAAGGNGLMWLPPMEASFVGQVLFGSGSLTPGEYEVVLLTEGDEEVSRSRFWVVAPGAMSTIEVAQGATGSSVEVSWTGSPADRFDWVAVYAAGELDLYNGYLAFAYTESTVDGSYEFTVDDFGEELPAGDYVAVLAADDHYVVLATAEFTIG